MNLVEHALAAVAIQAVIGLTTRNWWIGAALACGYFLGARGGTGGVSLDRTVR